MNRNAKESLKYLVLSILCVGVGYFLAFAENQPFEALPNSAVANGKYIRMFVAFQWGSVAVGLGCFLVIWGIAFFLNVLCNRMYAGGMSFLLFTDVERGFHRGLVAGLVSLLLVACREAGFAGLSRIHFQFEWRELFGSIYEKYNGFLWADDVLSGFYWLSIILSYVLIGVTVIYLIGARVLPRNFGKIYNVTGIIVSVAGLLAIFLSSYTNLWYFALSMFWLVLYEVIMLLLRKRRSRLEKETVEIIMDSGYLDDL